MRRGDRNLTTKTVAALRKPGWYCDRDIPGFVVRVLPSGTKAFAARYVVKGTGIRRFTSLGLFGVVTVDQARRKAREILSAVALGDDPLGKRCPTWGEWSVTYFDRLTAKSKNVFHRALLGFTEEKNKRSGEPTDSTFREIRLRWAPRLLSSFRPEDIERERAAIRAAKSATVANRWLAVVSGVFGAAVRAELLGRNPVKNVRSDREAPPRSRTLSTEEMGRLLAALEGEKERDPWAAAGVLLAVLTGARRGEILRLRWEDVRLDEGFARLPDSKSGKPRFLALPARAVEELRELHRVGSYVVAPARDPLPGKDGKLPPEKPRADLKAAWERLTTAAELEGITFHDLRRTFGRELNRAAGLRVAQEALGHSTPEQTAAAYTPEGFDTVKKATEERANLLPFPKRAAG